MKPAAPPAPAQSPPHLLHPSTLQRRTGRGQSGDGARAATFLIAVKSPDAPWLLSTCLVPRPGPEVLVTAVGLGGRALLPGEPCACCCSHLLPLPCEVCTTDTEAAATGLGAVSGWLWPGGEPCWQLEPYPAPSSPPGGVGVRGEPHDCCPSLVLAPLGSSGHLVSGDVAALGPCSARRAPGRTGAVALARVCQPLAVPRALPTTSLHALDHCCVSRANYLLLTLELSWEASELFPGTGWWLVGI